MSTEFRAIRKKRTSSGASSPNPTPEGDHRKRRRNRTTQSCLNCHASKRMCDRKRPCGRCTQLGLTGLCVYEVDDPSQRSDALDESSRLRQRVAELEGVIRELKNKPHPRWVKSGSTPGEEFERCHARNQSLPALDESAVESGHQTDSLHPSTKSNAGPREALPEKLMSFLANTSPSQEHFPSFFSSLPVTESSAPLPTLSYSPHVDGHSPPGAPSTGVVTPTEQHPQMQITVAGPDQYSTNDIDLTSLFMSHPDLLACDDGPGHVDQVLLANAHGLGQHFDFHSTKYSHRHLLDHCGCLHEAASYNVVLELSVRLRKAADILGHSAGHRFNNGCPLNQKIVDLDAFAMTTLGSVTASPNDFSPVHLCSRVNTTPVGPIPPSFSGIPPVRASAIPPPSLHDLGSWSGALSCTTDPSAPCDESFMTWQPSHRI